MPVGTCVTRTAESVFRLATLAARAMHINPQIIRVNRNLIRRINLLAAPPPMRSWSGADYQRQTMSTPADAPFLSYQFP